MNKRPIITRFAPSPTGFLHIGGARTALFNWLYARANGGEALLRIEDTDRKRATEGALDAIHEGLAWLGLNWDRDPVYQSQGQSRHSEIAHQLLAAGHAYKCFMTAEELTALRERQKANKEPFRYDRRWRDRPADEHPAQQAYAIRIKAPLDGDITIHDHIQGTVHFPAKDLDDFIILRSDGTPTYMLAAVVDDYDMGVTHLIRGDDHLNNAFRQRLIIDAMDWPIPEYAHIPLIHGSDGTKLSKRHGAVGVEYYRDKGVLSDALFNYLLRLGWSHGDKEIISREEAINWFSLDAIGKSPSRFDEKKLTHLNAHYINNIAPDRLLPYITPLIEESLENILDQEQSENLRKALPILQPRAKNLHELAQSSLFLFKKRPLALDEKAQSLLGNEQKTILKHILSTLQAIDIWDTDIVEERIRVFIAESGVGFGKVAQPIRAALTGTTQSPAIFDLLILLGRKEALARISDQLE